LTVFPFGGNLYSVLKTYQEIVQMEETIYQYSCSTGDIVQMPNGVVGIVSGVDFHCGGCVKEVSIFPFTNWLHRLVLVLSDRTKFHDETINKLRLLHPAL